MLSVIIWVVCSWVHYGIDYLGLILDFTIIYGKHYLCNLGKLLNLCKPQFPYLFERDNSIYLAELLWKKR